MNHTTKKLHRKKCILLIIISNDSHNLSLKLTSIVFILFTILKILMTQQYNIMYTIMHPRYRNLAQK